MLEKISIREKAPANWEGMELDEAIRYVSRILLRLWIGYDISDAEFKAATEWLEDQKHGTAPALIQEIWGNPFDRAHHLIVADIMAAVNRGSRG